MKKWYRKRRSHILILFMIITVFSGYYISLCDHLISFNSTGSYIDNSLPKALKEDKGTGCQIPHLDPFAKEIMQFVQDVPDLICDGRDWVKCYLHECRVVKEILDTMMNIKCAYRDIIYISDAKYIIGAPVNVFGKDLYKLVKSDFVKIMCTGKYRTDIFRKKWHGYGAGYREESLNVPPGVDMSSIDVLIFGFDSASKNGFIRKMPKSYRYITEDLGATVLNSYNILGDGTTASLFPLLTGISELEVTHLRKAFLNKRTLDDLPFTFSKLKKRGFHTAYFEDMPRGGTFQYKHNGFKHQPADHYLRAFLLEQGTGVSQNPNHNYCIGDTPRFMVMMNLTEQFFKLPGRHFAFTFIADICHDIFNMISTADDATVDFLRRLKDEGHLENTLLIVMGDHGVRFGEVRNTMQGKVEERLPLMTIRLPPTLTDKRPGILTNLVANTAVLTTPHDIHATILDALNMKEHINHYKIQGADLERSLSLFEAIPSNRSCSEAGIRPHWCICHTWQHVSASETVYWQAADAFLTFLNSLTESARSLCIPRTLTSVLWVQRINNRLIGFKSVKNLDNNSQSKVTRTTDMYQIKVAVGPGIGIYEASATYIINQNKFVYDSKDVSRVNAYNDEPSCISATLPHLNKYCYCKDHRTLHSV